MEIAQTSCSAADLIKRLRMRSARLQRCTFSRICPRRLLR
ncbi:hypothetical protein CLOSTMETH_00108 [[Clostridium] methylpentosum DSM 5476]|uniref:Uncharacterized protein n=1 Tax=[Clostridium] methylpentosum DSM 5476 TaxID=537013 RepID=C0E8G3_9FIRM|nr:hypothetical protein CLOSTMETH_00108 [[Clostridium] methylpentosum DSM 5476]